MNKKLILFISLLSLLILHSCKKDKEDIPSTPIIPEDFSTLRGVDISFLPEIRTSNFVAKNENGIAEDMLYTLRTAGVNIFRLRIWVHPANQHSGLEEVKTLSKEIKNTGAKVWLTVHYSDTWADPGNQQKPARWASANFDQLKDSVYQYTKKIMQEINPDYIQIGNEINNGFLWPDGSYSLQASMKLLLKEGIKAVRENSTQTKIMIHYAGHAEAMSFYSSINNLDYDIIALSYYPKWHGKDLDSLANNLKALSSNFNKEIILAETSYPFTFGWNDWTNNVVGSEEEIIDTYAASPEGQKAYLQKIRSILESTPKGIGFCYWGAEWVSFKGNTANNGSSYENQAFWDFEGKALPVIKAYHE